MKQKVGWWVRSLIIALVVVPAMANGVALGGVALFVWEVFSRYFHRFGGSHDYLLSESVLKVVIFALGGVVMFFIGWLWARFTRPAYNGVARQNVLLAPALLALLVWIVALCFAQLSFVNLTLYKSHLTVALSPWPVITSLFLFLGWPWGIVLIPVGSQICFTLGCCRHNRRVPASRQAKKIRRLLILLLLALGLIALWQARFHEERYPAGSDAISVNENIDRRAYRPTGSHSQLTPLHGAPRVRFSPPCPRLDGATALLPLYASAFYGLCDASGKRDRFLPASGAARAYEKIIDGTVDMIFTALPSAQQMAQAEEAQVPLLYTPFAREAFVFIVRADNPVESLTEQQLRDIFSGKITRWSEVGGDNTEIQVWQRPADSDSQSAMLTNVMKATPMLPPKETEVFARRGNVIRKVADYQNTRRSIGYTFRYYATRMNKNSGIKLLAIDGVAPTVENIQSGAWPWTVDMFMVTRQDAPLDIHKLSEWFLSPQGQRLVQDTGYVPLGE
ncbi:PstS family phosphate ABC transporter substrate-binding protein [Intestinirhabdus alba]|jgi:phosphate transport system substrate-binding protein|uniref:PBP domain-containing protein n=1 Tax=Intestinirhabdus alba TaxID=2899544 RepID=A0A6L6INV9_9ENTR|nr:PstS family phosphate ABC transporter substrate-binding protein [Intestinirhabdus alba]MTH48521.1 hypothetical protein [Intestinirhabdus alba]